MVGGGKSIRYLVDQPKPRTYICDVARSWKVLDSIEVFPCWAHTVKGYLKPSKGDGVSSEYKFVRIEGDTVATADVKPFNCLPEGVFKVVGPQESVVDAFCFVGDVCNDLVEPPGAMYPWGTAL